jgi:hypothetical protein
MKKLYKFIAMLIIILIYQAIGKLVFSQNTDSNHTGTISNNPAVLKLSDSIKTSYNGLLIPQMNTLQMNTIAIPINRLIISNFDYHAINYYNGNTTFSSFPFSTGWLGFNTVLPDFKIVNNYGAYWGDTLFSPTRSFTMLPVGYSNKCSPFLLDLNYGLGAASAIVGAYVWLRVLAHLRLH